MDSVSVSPTSFCSECGRPTATDELARFGDRLICPICKDSYAQKLREGVAPVTTFVYAGFWIRVVAYLIDAVILAIAQGILQFAFLSALITIPRIEPGTAPQDIPYAQLFGAIGLLSLAGMAIAGTYEAVFVWRLGATPGKMAVGLKVVRPDGSLLSFGRAVGRYFAKMLSGLILCIGYIMVAFDASKRGLHDMICDTRVIQTRS